MRAALTDVLSSYADEVIDADEEIFELFSIYEGSSPLGMVARGEQQVDVTIKGRDFTINQSPGLLTSSRTEGTTGAVLWNINPLFAEWISSPSNFLWTTGLLTGDTTGLELGAGISPLAGLCSAPHIRRYILTDQEYVLKLLRQNVETNLSSDVRRVLGKQKSVKSSRPHWQSLESSNIDVVALDWETSDVGSIMTLLDRAPDVLFAVDCIFNPAIIQPFVSALKGLSELADTDARPVVSIIAQQLRSPDVFSDWLEAMLQDFRVWRVSDKALSTISTEIEKPGLRIKQGYVVHICILKEKQ